MFRLVDQAKAKKAAEEALRQTLRQNISKQGKWNIGFPGGNFDRTVYSKGAGSLWAAFGEPMTEHKIPRSWNGFGEFDASSSSQTIVVEINIPTSSNSEQVAGFFAEDPDTRAIYLMHSGKIGGGRPGIGRRSYLLSSKAIQTEVSCADGSIRRGIIVGKHDDSAIVDRIWRFVQSVKAFKEAAAKGEFNTPEFEQRLAEFDHYSKEFSGSKKVRGHGTHEYITYHGDVVEALFQERTTQAQRGEMVFNSGLADLYVKRNGSLSEVYEVKTALGRQALYTAIGQLSVHGYLPNAAVGKYLVLPADEDLPSDIAAAVIALGIKLRRFRLVGQAKIKRVELE